MSVATTTWPRWLPRVLWMRHMCPSCTSVEFKPAELRPYDGLLALFFLHQPVPGAKYGWATEATCAPPANASTYVVCSGKSAITRLASVRFPPMYESGPIIFLGD